MAAQTLLVLGDFVFDPSLTTHDLPDKIPLGGAQRIGVHQKPGGVRVIDAMGADDHDLSWSGMFFGPQATDKARRLDFMRKQGAPLPLSWDVFSYLVVVESFEADFERFFQIPYKITVKVVQDQTQPVGQSQQNSVDTFVRGDMANVLGMAANLGMTVAGSLPGPFSTTLGATLVTAAGLVTFNATGQVVI